MPSPTLKTLCSGSQVGVAKTSPRNCSLASSTTAELANSPSGTWRASDAIASGCAGMTPPLAAIAAEVEQAAEGDDRHARDVAVRDHDRRRRRGPAGHDRSPARARAAHRPRRSDRRPARRDRLLRLQHGDRRDGDRDGPAPRGLHLPRARPALPDLDRRADARARPGRRPHRRLRAAGDPAALPADLRRPPRWPRGDREGAPGAARRAHRAAEPRAFRDRIDQTVRAGRRNQQLRRGHDHGSRPLQGDQRHARASHGRPAAAGGRAPAARSRCATPTRSRASAATSSACCSRTSTRPATPPMVAENILMHLREPFVLEGMRLEIDASIGLALYPLHGEDNETLQQRADIAMYSAKQSGRGHAIFEPELDRHSPRRLALAGGLRSAISDGHIQLYYQPKADLRTGRIIGAEALARWDHAEFGIVGPSEFVPIAEQTGPDHAADVVRARRRDPPGARVEGRRPGALGRGQPLRPLVPGHAARGRDPAPARQVGRRRPSCSSSRSPRAC